MTTGPQSLSPLHISAIEEDSTLDISIHLTEMYVAEEQDSLIIIFYLNSHLRRTSISPV